MPSISTANWLESSGIGDLSTGALGEYALNGTAGWTLRESGSPTDSNQFRFWNTYTPPYSTITVNTPAKTVRPDQHFSRFGGGTHAHFIPSVAQVRAYGVEINEGGGHTSRNATGVIGLFISTFRVGFGTWNGNDAQIELDIYITPKTDYNRRLIIRDFTLATLNIGSTQASTGFVYRTGLGTGTHANGAITHNAAASQLEWMNWDATALANESGPLIISYRIHSPVAPYQDSTPVTQTEPFSFIFNPGVYGDAPPTQHVIRFEGQIRGAGTTSISHGNYQPAKDIRASGAVRTRTEITIDIRRHHAIQVNGRIQLGAEVEIVGRTEHSIQVNGEARLQITEIRIGADRRLPIAVEGEITAAGQSVLTVNGTEIVGPIRPDGQSGYMPAVAMGLWKRLRIG